jgi:hypothetical protein
VTIEIASALVMADTHDLNGWVSVKQLIAIAGSELNRLLLAQEFILNFVVFANDFRILEV